MKNIEYAYRICYKSEGRATEDSYLTFIPKRIGHGSPLEHSVITVLITCSRGIQQEITRHRHTAFSIESTRWINYFKKQGGEIFFIDPEDDMTAEQKFVYVSAFKHTESAYNKLIEMGVKPERARDVLPLGLKSEIVMSGNVRTWRNIFQIRLIESGAHIDFVNVMKMIGDEFLKRGRPLFADLLEKKDDTDT